MYFGMDLLSFSMHSSGVVPKFLGGWDSNPSIEREDPTCVFNFLEIPMKLKKIWSSRGWSAALVGRSPLDPPMKLLLKNSYKLGTVHTW